MWLWVNQWIQRISVCGCDDNDGDDNDEEEGGGRGMKEQDSASFWTPAESVVYIEPEYGKLEESHCLDSQFDPDDDYIKNFDQLGWHVDSMKPIEGFSTSLVEKLAQDSEQALSSTELTPREITHNLHRFSSAIRMTSDNERKANYIRLYELRKFDHDEDNKDDKEKALFALEDARNKAHKSMDRIRHYQTAIKFTNNVTAKEEVRAEYRRYCSSLQR